MSTLSREAELGVDFADIYRRSQLYKCGTFPQSCASLQACWRLDSTRRCPPSRCLLPCLACKEVVGTGDRDHSWAHELWCM